jgi:hypothetical protein
MEHSKYGPSSAYRWLHCPPSAEATDFDDPCEAAELGTWIHDIVSESNIRAALARESEKMTPEQRAVAEQCVTGWLNIIEQAYLEPGDIIVETRMISKVFLNGDFGGTADLLRITPDTIHVYDLKTGQKAVSAEDNPQLAMYLLLAKEYFPGRERFFGTICQPQLDYVSEHEFTAAALANFRDMLKRCENSTERKAGDHCEHCPLLTKCDTAYQEAIEILQGSPRALPPIDPELPADIARWKRLVEYAAVVAELEPEGRRIMLEHIQDGNSIAGWKQSTYGGRRSWSNPTRALEVLSEQVGDAQVLIKTVLKSPAQLEKLGVQIDPDLIFKPEGKPILAKRSSPKTEIVPADGSEFDES